MRAKSRLSTAFRVWIASPTVPSTGILRPISLSGSPSTARQTSAPPSGAIVQQSAASAATSVRSSSTSRLITESNLQVAGQRLAGLQERPLLGDPALAVAEQTARVDRARSLAGDRLGEQDLSPRPAARLLALDPEHPDHAVGGDDRGGEHRPDVAVRELLEPTELRTLEPSVLGDVRDLDRPPLSDREVDVREAARVAERVLARLGPLGQDRLRLARLSEADEAPRRVQRATGTLHRGAEQILELVPGAHVEGDPRDEPLALQHLRELLRGLDPRQRQPRLEGERLHQRELFLPEEAWLPNADEDDADHGVGRDHRHEGAARDLRDGVQAPADDRRRVDVEDGECPRIAYGRADSGGLAVELDHLVDERLEVVTALAGTDDPGVSAVLLDQDEIRQIELEQIRQLVQDMPGDGSLVVRVEEGAGQAPHGLELPVLPRRAPLGLARPLSGRDEQHAVAPVREQDDNGHGREEDRRQGEPEVLSERLPLDQYLDPDDPERDSDAGKEQGDRVAGLARVVAPEERGEGEPDPDVQRRQEEQRNCVEKDRLGVSVHGLPR